MDTWKNLLASKHNHTKQTLTQLTLIQVPLKNDEQNVCENVLNKSVLVRSAGGRNVSSSKHFIMKWSYDLYTITENIFHTKHTYQKKTNYPRDILKL